ncbi:hypothetical protein ACLOJK_011047 [Asimina triloba]
MAESRYQYWEGSICQGNFGHILCLPPPFFCSEVEDEEDDDDDRWGGCEANGEMTTIGVVSVLVSYYLNFFLPSYYGELHSEEEEKRRGEKGKGTAASKEEEIRRAAAFGRQGSTSAVRTRAALRHITTLATCRSDMCRPSVFSFYLQGWMDEEEVKNKEAAVCKEEESLGLLIFPALQLLRSEGGLP